MSTVARARPQARRRQSTGTEKGHGRALPARPRPKTNPLKRDTDNGGVADGREDRNRDGRVDKGETDPTKPGDKT